MTKPIQHSYLLRFWRDHDRLPVRMTLVPVVSPDQPRHFADLDQPSAFLIAQADIVALADDRPEWDGDHCTPVRPC